MEHEYANRLIAPADDARRMTHIANALDTQQEYHLICAACLFVLSAMSGSVYYTARAVATFASSPNHPSCRLIYIYLYLYIAVQTNKSCYSKAARPRGRR